MTEAEFQHAVEHLARLGGWLRYHSRPSQVRPGVWRTNYSGDAGFPDLVLLRDRLILAELKTDRGRPTPDQLAWLARARAAGIEAYLWRPTDLQTITDLLLTRSNK